MLLWRWPAVARPPPDSTALPVTVADIDAAPTVLPPPNVNWEERYNQLSARFNTVSDENFSLKEENSRLRRANNTRALLDQLIVPFAEKAFLFMCGYCGFTGLILIACGIGFHFKLEASVLELLVGSTATTVIGLVGMVLTGVFVGAGKT